MKRDVVKHNALPFRAARLLCAYTNPNCTVRVGRIT